MSGLGWVDVVSGLAVVFVNPALKRGVKPLGFATGLGSSSFSEAGGSVAVGAVPALGPTALGGLAALKRGLKPAGFVITGLFSTSAVAESLAVLVSSAGLSSTLLGRLSALKRGLKPLGAAGFVSSFA